MNAQLFENRNHIAAATIIASTSGCIHVWLAVSSLASRPATYKSNSNRSVEGGSNHCRCEDFLHT
jgi:hypothetical protein